jgi:RimJ/RimL family protein N-acetyltransferase
MEKLDYDGVSLLPYRPELDEKTVHWLNLKEIRHSFGITRNVNLESHRKWVSEQHDFLMWGLFQKESGHIGTVSLRLSPRHFSTYFEMYIGEPRFQNRGYGWKALTATLNYAFGKLGLHRVWLYTFPDNIPSKKLYKKAGFTIEGTERDCLFKDGRFESMHRWSLLASEWDFSVAQSDQ